MKGLSFYWLDRLVAARRRIVLSVLLFSITPSFAEEAGNSGGRVAIRAGKVLTMDAGDTVINNAVVLVKGGAIEHIGLASDTTIPVGYRVINAQDKWVFPGIIDAHNHTAGSLMDLNDMVYLSNPGLRTLETILPDNERIKGARAGGVTTVLLIPGSGTNMSGFGTIAKTAGKTVDEVVVRSPGSLKIAQAGNPEWYWYGVGRSFMNYNTRQTLEKARAYHEAWEAYEKGAVADSPAFDPIFDEFRGLFRGEFPVSVHTQIYQVLMTTVDMLATKMKIKTVLDHCTFDAFKVAPLVLKTDAFTINGPRQYWFDRSQRKMHGNAARWWQGGVRKLGINTDAPVVPQRELSYQAAMACWYGWLPYPALAGVTRVPAASLMIDDRVGSLEVGKVADFGIWTGDPLDPRSSCVMTFVRGELVYDASVKRRF
ncbi:MAG: amidohydrolase family protein [Planctomycetes bacterium]|nr:amidohydrolase family protein [Planctomycetota bacterium]